MAGTEGLKSNDLGTVILLIILAFILLEKYSYFSQIVFTSTEYQLHKVHKSHVSLYFLNWFLKFKVKFNTGFSTVILVILCTLYFDHVFLFFLLLFNSLPILIHVLSLCQKQSENKETKTTKREEKNVIQNKMKQKIHKLSKTKRKKQRKLWSLFL